MDQPNKFDPFKQFDQAKVSLLEAKVARLTAEQRDLVDAQDLSNEATMRGAVSRHTIIRGGGFPWGSQWCWGFEFTDTKFRLHKPLVKIRSRLYNVCTGGDSLTETMYSEIAKSTGKWGVCVDVDWSDFPTSAGSLRKVSSLAAMKQPPGGEGSYGSKERIPVAWFDGTGLLWDMIHTIYHPVIWA